MTGRLAPRSPLASAALVFALALLVRLAYLYAFRDSPFFNHPVVDARWHDEWAWAWARGEWSPEGRAFFRAPLYPFWLSVLYRIFGHDLAAVRLVQAVIGAGTAAVLAGAGRRLAGRGAGIAAGLIAALYGPFIFFDAELLIPNLLLALLSWALFLLLGPPTKRNAIAAGALLGLAAIARPTALVVLPAAVLWVVFRGRGSGAASDARDEALASDEAKTERNAPRRHWLRGAAVAVLGLVPALAVTAYNARVEGAAVFIASQGGVNFYAGNHERASGRGMEVPELEDISGWRGFVDRTEDLAERDVGRPLDSREVSNWWLHRGLGWLRAHPADASVLYLRKAAYLIDAYETPSNRDLYFERPGPLRALLWKTPWFAFPWGLLLPLAVAGFVVGRRDPRVRGGTGFLLAWTLLYAAFLLPFFINARFRLPLVPGLILLAAVALSRPRRSLAVRPLALALIALVLSNAGLAGARVENSGQELARLGHVLVADGRLEEAREALEEAHRLDPRSATAAAELAGVYAQLDRPADAVSLYEYVVGIRPQDAAVRFELAVQYLKLGRFEDASRELEQVVALEPADAAAWANFALASAEAGQFDRALEAVRRAERLEPENAEVRRLREQIEARR